jgi:hypothetical protein
MKMDVLFEQNEELERRTMMKKVLALVLVLSMAGIASAGYQIAMPDKVNVNTDATFQIVIGGAAGEAYDGGVYGLMPDSFVVSPNAGNLGGVTPFAEYVGVDFAIGDLQGLGVKAGEWVTLTYKVGAKNTVQNFDFFDYAISTTQAVSSRSVAFIPEPMTLSLLGLGALVLRRRS